MAVPPSDSLIERWVCACLPTTAARYSGVAAEWRALRFRAIWESDGPADIAGYFRAEARRAAEAEAEAEAEALAGVAQLDMFSVCES